MGKFKDIYELIATFGAMVGSYSYTSIKEFANITNKADRGEYLFLLNSDNVRITNRYTGRTLSKMVFEIFIIQNHSQDAFEIDIAEIQDACFDKMNAFFYEMNKPNSDYFALIEWDSRMVRNTTPNCFAGVKFDLTIETANNL